MRNNKEVLDNTATLYLDKDPCLILNGKIQHLIAEYIVDSMPSNLNKVLEMGIGENIWPPLILEKFPKYSVVDASAKLVNHYSPIYQSITYHESYFEQFYPASKFDQIICSNVLDFVEDPLVALMHIKDWMHKDSLLHIAVPNADSIHRRLAVAMKIQEQNSDKGKTNHIINHTFVFTIEEIKKNLKKCGFKIKSIEGLFYKPFPNDLLLSLNKKQIRGLFDLAFTFPPEDNAVMYIVATL